MMLDRPSSLYWHSCTRHSNPGKTMPHRLSLKLASLLAVVVTLFPCPASAAQLTPAPSPLADPAERHFQAVHEDWTSPALNDCHLNPDPPLGFVIDKPLFTMELVRLQWRRADPIDVYVMKPKGVKNPPVILYLYGYPTDTDIFRNEDYENLVTRNGFAAVGFASALTGHRYHDRPMKQWFVSGLHESLTTSAHDVQMVLNYLAGRGSRHGSRGNVRARVRREHCDSRLGS